jgi:hypothetical protein
MDFEVELLNSPPSTPSTLLAGNADAIPHSPGPCSKGRDGHWEPPHKDWIYALEKPDMALRKNRTLVVCFDGTGDSFDNDNSNVVQFVSMLRKDDHGVNTSGKPHLDTEDHGGVNLPVLLCISLVNSTSRLQQMVYYQPGIGTYTSPLLTTAPFINSVAKTLDEMFAWNLGVHVTEGYSFLMQNCRDP